MQNVNESSIHYRSSQQKKIDKKKPLKICKKNNKIQIDKNIERVQNKQQETIFKWNLIYDEL
jgi:ABC-type transport system involved in Fe-S cluster assembly fused permease/ATPase subunit